MSFFTVQDLCAGYGGQPVLRSVNFTLQPGCLAGILGANGSGKTTLLKAIGGILPHTGRCLLGQTPLETLRPRELAQHCSYIPQRSGIGIDISVLDVVLMGFNPRLGLLERPTAAMRAAACDALARVGLAGREQENYLHLSEGQRQLCILARTLAAGGELLLLDEPESALDLRYRTRMLALLRRWVHAGPHGALAALHDPALALNGCDRLLVLAGGRVQAVLDPQRDPLPAMEAALTTLYGPISLQRCRTRQGAEQIVLLKEPEEDRPGEGE